MLQIKYFTLLNNRVLTSYFYLMMLPGKQFLPLWDFQSLIPSASPVSVVNQTEKSDQLTNLQKVGWCIFESH